MRLPSAAVRAGTRLIACDIVGSTNAEALEQARQGETGPLWITARQQTGGRGRRGRVWVSEPGNLYATLLLTNPAPGARAVQLSFVAALAAHDAVAAVAPQLASRLALKWPNDLLLGDAKLGGILIEAEEVRRRLAVVIGIGLNCARHPAETAYPATDLTAAGALVGPEPLFAALSEAMQVRLAQWSGGDDFAGIRAAWLARAAGRGGDIVVRLGDRETAGRFEALDETGRLMLRHADGRLEPIAVGDVMALPPAVGHDQAAALTAADPER